MQVRSTHASIVQRNDKLTARLPTRLRPQSVSHAYQGKGQRVAPSSRILCTTGCKYRTTCINGKPLAHRPAVATEPVPEPESGSSTPEPDGELARTCAAVTALEYSKPCNVCQFIYRILYCVTNVQWDPRWQ